jgi:hypothetical protein
MEICRHHLLLLQEILSLGVSGGIRTLFRAAAVDLEVEITRDDIKTVNSAEGKERQVVIVKCSPRGQ